MPKTNLETGTKHRYIYCIYITYILTLSTFRRNEKMPINFLIQVNLISLLIQTNRDRFSYTRNYL